MKEILIVAAVILGLGAGFVLGTKFEDEGIKFRVANVMEDAAHKYWVRRMECRDDKPYNQ
jgi:hypothetical protein